MEVTDSNVTRDGGIQVLHMLAGLMKCTLDNAVDRCRPIFISCIVETVLATLGRGWPRRHGNAEPLVDYTLQKVSLYNHHGQRQPLERCPAH